MNIKLIVRAVTLTCTVAVLSACSTFDWPGPQIDSEANEALVVFREEVNGADVFLDQAAGYLVFPRVLKAGLGVGGETGEGALRVRDKTIDYFRITSGSVGFQAGAQARSIVIAFMTESSLEQFRNSSGWRVGIDGSVALIDIGAGKTIDSQNIRDPVVGFIFGSAGLMYNLTLEGTRFTRLNKE